MQHYRQWSAVFASYFTILGLWTAFGPGTLMRLNPQAAPTALAAITLAYFAATPVVLRLWRGLGFANTLGLLGGLVLVFLCLAAVLPAYLPWCAPLAFFCGSGAYTLCETRMLEDLTQAGRSHAFGGARKWGSCGFLVAAMVGGAVFSLAGVGRSFVLALAACALAFFWCCLALRRAVLLPGTAATPDRPAPDSSLQGAGRAAGVAPGRAARDTRAGCAAIAGMRLAEAISTTWFGAYWLHTGHSPFETGLLCALPVASEFLAMWKGAGLMARFSASAVMLMCCGASAVRWLATPYCSALWCAVPLQSLHAFSFGFFYPASLIWMRELAGQDFFQIRYVTESLARVLTAGVSFVAAGWLIASYGYVPLFATSMALALLSAAWWLYCLQQARKPGGAEVVP